MWELRRISFFCLLTVTFVARKCEERLFCLILFSFYLSRNTAQLETVNVSFVTKTCIFYLVSLRSSSRFVFFAFEVSTACFVVVKHLKKGTKIWYYFTLLRAHFAREFSLYFVSLLLWRKIRVYMFINISVILERIPTIVAWFKLVSNNLSYPHFSLCFLMQVVWKWFTTFL